MMSIRFIRSLEINREYNAYNINKNEIPETTNPATVANLRGEI